MLYLLVSVGFIRGATSDDQGLLNFESLVNLVGSGSANMRSITRIVEIPSSHPVNVWSAINMGILKPFQASYSRGDNSSIR